jgi:hypothetical protein
VSIYVPDDLKGRMDEAGESINWSEVARPAFVAAIAAHEHRKALTMTTTIERLRASKDKYLEKIQDEGVEAGRAWARDRAEFEELRNVANLHESHSSNGLDVTVNDLKKAMDPEDDLSVRDFAEILGFDDQEPSDEFAAAFAEGATDIWIDVKDEL